MLQDKSAYSVSEFCLLYGVGRSTVYEELNSGRLRAVKVGRRTLILFAAAEAWAKSLSPALRQGGA